MEGLDGPHLMAPSVALMYPFKYSILAVSSSDSLYGCPKPDEARDGDYFRELIQIGPTFEELSLRLCVSPRGILGLYDVQDFTEEISGSTKSTTFKTIKLVAVSQYSSP